MSIAKPFTFVANTYAKSSEVNADFDIVYSQVNTNISDIAQNARDISNLENNKADINGNISQRFAVADAVSNGDAINKQTLFKQIGNSLDYISGLVITKDSGSPEDTIIVSAGSAYDSTHSIVLSLDSSISKQNTNQAASATYYVYIIGTSTGSLTDILISTSSTTPTLPSGYTLFRQIGYYTTDSNNKIDTISYYGESATSDKSANGILDATAPDWANMVDRSATTTYTATTAGYVYGYITRLRESKTCTITINSQYSFSSYMPIGAVGGYWNSCNLLIPVGKGDTYYMNNNGASYVFKFIPVKGGN